MQQIIMSKAKGIPKKYKHIAEETYVCAKGQAKKDKLLPSTNTWIKTK
jgi:hypothetical protein